jgi:endonuclease I
MKTTMKTLTLTALGFAAVKAQPFTNCDPSDYYNFPSPTYSNLRTLIIDTHRNVLPNSGETNVYTALVDLFEVPSPDGSVRQKWIQMAFREIVFPAIPYANPNTWERADIWPISRGALRLSDALTDVHSKMCVDSTVLSEWKVLNSVFFGMCGTVQSEGQCSLVDQTTDTYSDTKIWQPPAPIRGDIARMLFYDVLRYGNELGLELVDCPPFTDTQFGYLSALLQWHIDDPVDESELMRNNVTCTSWQGNRNPFIDFPELVAQFFGEPDEILPGTTIYSKCITPTMEPTATPNECSSLSAGDVQVILMNSDEPDQITFFTLDLIPAGIEYIYLTDDAWDGTKFAGKEGTVRIQVPEESFGGSDGKQKCRGWCPGTVYSYGFPADKGNWTDVDTTMPPFQLNYDGDSVLTYCINADEKPIFLNGFTNAPGGWAAPGLSDYGTASSSLPAGLELNGSVAVPYFPNYVYTGINKGRYDILLLAFSMTENYNGSYQRMTVPELNTSSSAKTSAILASALALVAGIFLL